MNLLRSSLVACAFFLALSSCSSKDQASTIRVGSKNFTEALIVGEIYAQLLEHHGYTVQRKLNLGGTQIAMAALQRGDIDLYPEYTGTALLVQLQHPPLRDAARIYATVKHEYQQRYHLTWLEPAPMNDSQGLATTQAIATKYHLQTLSQLSTLAPQLRLGAIPEFVSRPDALPGLQKFYGGFRFKETRMLDNGLKYRALLAGSVDIVPAFTTDGLIEAEHFVVLQDDRHFWPIYNVAPVVRDDALAKNPPIARILNAVAPRLTDATMRRLNYEVDGKKREPADVAGDFIRQTGLLTEAGAH